MSYSRTIQFNSRRQGSWARNQNRAAFIPTAKMGPVTHTVIVGIMVAILTLLYLSQVNRITSYDYAASDVSDKISSLEQEKQNLEVENARLTAIQNIKDSSVAKAMVQPENVQRVSE